MKKVLSGIGIVLIVVLLLPIIAGMILLALLAAGILAIVEYIPKKIRHDPKLKLDHIITLPEQAPETTKELREYFEKSVGQLAMSGGAHASDVRDVTGEWSEGDEVGSWRNYSLECVLETKYARTAVSTEVVEIRRENGEIELVEEDEDYSSSDILAKIDMLSGGSKVEVYLDSLEAEWFFVQLLKGEYTINTNLKKPQNWTHLPDSKAWIVKYYDGSSSAFGTRREYQGRRARQYWVDTAN